MGPFCRHIIDAIAINFVRSFKYAKLSYGFSLPISWGLILFEVSILPLAFYYDLMNRLFWKPQGWALLNEDFIDMKWTPQFQDEVTDIPSGYFSLILVNQCRVHINNLLKKSEWQQANKAIKAIREGLEPSHATYPLVNHFLESVHRCIALTCAWALENDLGEIGKSEEERKVQQRFLKHRQRLCWWQMVGFEGALILDFLSWPLRKKGLAILAQDVPTIPVPNSSHSL